MSDNKPDFQNPVPPRGPRIISDYDGPGYSQEPGHTPLNKTWESANRWHPTPESLYPNGRLRNPDGKLGSNRHG